MTEPQAQQARESAAVPASRGAPADPMVRYGPTAAVLVVIIGLVLRLRGVSEYWLNPDEGIYYSTLTRSSLSAFWSEVSANAHPPLFYLLLRAAGAVTWDFVWLRGVSVLFGTVAIWAFWLVGRELGGRGTRTGTVAGLVAAGLLALNLEAVTLSQVIRPYMMVAALLAFALFHVLRYRSDPTVRRLALYSACMVAALLIHYSAVLALGALVVVVAHYRLTRAVDTDAWRRLALAQLLPAGVFGALYVRHVSATMDSELMGNALNPGGWLSQWLVSTPGEAWFSFTTFQVFHLPPDFRGRAALLLLAALALAAARDRLVLVAGGAALLAALTASALGVYPFGPTRHDTWLVVFTLPALGWLFGDLVERGGRPAAVAAGVLTVALVLGGPLERTFGADLELTNATEEQVLRTADLAPLVVRQMDPEGSPAAILMTEQSYNLLVPLYADGRGDETLSPDGAAFEFSYGRRRIHVTRAWDWGGLEELRTTLSQHSTAQDTVLVIAGGWGSGLFSDLPELRDTDAVLDEVAVLGRTPEGQPIVRMIGLVLDRSALAEAAP